MISSETLAITYGLGSAITWGAGDFSGGVASKRNNVFTVILFSQIIGLALLTALAVLLAEKPLSLNNFFLGGLAGISGMMGIAALYTGLARGRMGIVAPLSAIIAAMIPIFFAAFTEGLPDISQFFGFGIAAVSVWFLSRSAGGGKIQADELYFSAGAGLGFALFFIFIDRVNSDAVLWPLVSARIASVSLMTAVMVPMRQISLPSRSQFLTIALTGVFDAAGNTFFVLATRSGRLDISAVLASLAPAATVFLARLILKEALSLRQGIGVCTALAAIILIAL